MNKRWMVLAGFLGILVSLYLLAAQSDDAAPDAAVTTQVRKVTTVTPLKPAEARNTVRRQLRDAFYDTADPEAHRNGLRRVIRSSGSTEEAWTSDALSFMANWAERAEQVAQTAQTTASESRTAELGQVECYREGCVTTVRFSSRLAFGDLGESMVLAENRPGWRGQVIASSPQFENDGTVRVEWVLLRPESEEQ